jgi:hypothetical protein
VTWHPNAANRASLSRRATSRTRPSACDAPCPALCPGCGLLSVFPPGSPPSLPHLRNRSLLRRIRRHHETIRLPTLAHLRRATVSSTCFPNGPPGDHPGRASVGSPGSHAWRLRTCPGSLTARGPQTARASADSGVAFRLTDNVSTPIATFRGSIPRPARAPLNASPRPRGTPTHDSGPPQVASPST